jgi:predicted TIM-barrel fold metal-dependent hydrolase
MGPIHLTAADEQALYDQLSGATYSAVLGGREDSDAAEPANLHEYPGDDAVASADRFARGCVEPLHQLKHELEQLRERNAQLEHDNGRMRFMLNQPSPTAPVAFRGLQAALRADPDYAWAWHCNVAMPVMDATGVSHEVANATAARLMRHLFDIDITTHACYRAMFENKAMGVKPAPRGVA